MDTRLIETGKIINTHGVRGEVKIEPWANSPTALLDYRRFFIDGREFPVERSRVNKRFVIAKLRGVDDMTAAEALRDRVLSVAREDLRLSEGEYLLADLTGLTAIDAASGEKLGTITELLSPPGGEVAVIQGTRELLVPLRPEFVERVDFDAGTVRFRLLEGM